MGSTKSAQVSRDVFPYLRVYDDGTVERLAGTEVVDAGFDPRTNVFSKDIVISPETGVSVRVYRPGDITTTTKLPLVVYFHGGGFMISSTADPKYHTSLNNLVAEAGVIVVSVNYRLAPEHPLPAAYEDSWDALNWVASQVMENKGEAWLQEFVDNDRVYLAGDSAGANIAHHLALRITNKEPSLELKVVGIAMVMPYFWGKDPIGIEVSDEFRKEMVDNWWMTVCPSGSIAGCDDPLINPIAEGAASVAGLACEKLLVIVAEKDILRDRGRLYYEHLVNSTSEWPGKAEIFEAKGEDHVFHIIDPDTHSAKSLIKRLASFIDP